MFLSGIDFTLLLLLFTGKLKKVSQHAAVKAGTLMSVILFTAFIAAVLYRTTPMGAEESFRKAFFQVASLHTSTGFGAAHYTQWVPVLWGTLTVIMLISACAGSTTGRYEMHPNGDSGQSCHEMNLNTSYYLRTPVLPVRVNKQVISPAYPVDGTGILIHLCRHCIIVSVLSTLAMGVGFTESIGTGDFKYRKYGTGIGELRSGLFMGRTP